MKKLYRLKNVIQEYAWGSPTLLPELLGFSNPKQTPQAELWLGAHERGMSQAIDGKMQINLDALIRQNPPGFLGPKAAERFKTLPFLFKVLAAGSPLSIQAHPAKEQAEAGFARENRAGISLNAENRNYRDSNHKPEIICALYDNFWALCGFRPLSEIIENFKQADFSVLRKESAALASQPNEKGLQTFFAALLNLDAGRAAKLADEAQEQAFGRNAPQWQWVQKLYAAYPNDCGSLAPLYLNLVCLKAGQALYLPAGVLHAYLEGLGVELMANSDNVLRGGLTAKHIDKKELLSILTFAGGQPAVLEAQGANGLYAAPSSEFALQRLLLTEQRLIGANNPCQIILCVKGKARLLPAAGNVKQKNDSQALPLTIQRGEAVFMPYKAGGYNITGRGEFFIASIPAK